MTPPASPRLPEAVEQAVYEYGAASLDLGVWPGPTTERRQHDELAALRAAILAYGAARERQGIERAARVVCKYCAAKQPLVLSQRLGQWIHEPLGRGPFNGEGYIWDYCKVAEARALPVNGATP